ncbi:DoxX family protein [Paenibacillus sp. 481]|uniref:DoxX family protein n=1 Tax=Paenibacillus sp. 481 TaxID=2835869 RepID=UPI001E4C7B35|nr:DoxX family protein [Paenibacillus sp. 481]UHA75037.1 DoxX family protein [Paenibacillus sp. 481]
MWADYGLLLIRAVIGLTMIGHGAQKLFGWFGGYGLQGTGGWMESIGLRPGVQMALLAGLTELTGGLLFGLGMFTWIGALLIVGTMLMAIVKVHGPNGYWVTQNGFEYNLMLLVTVIGVALIGAGAFSIDALMS